MIKRYRVARDASGNVTLELGGQTLRPNKENDILITRDSESGITIFPHHCTRATDDDNLMVLRFKDKDKSLYFRKKKVENQQDLPPEIWGGDLEEFWAILTLLAIEANLKNEEEVPAETTA